MATTPSPPASRARTPPTPLHGVRSDIYEPYSPRRSKRVTAQANPYGSFNSDRSPCLDITPPPTTKKSRFSRGSVHLSSPPASPISPATTLRSSHKTPRKTPVDARRSLHPAGFLSDSDNPFTSLDPPNVDPSTMLPTPLKTPRKRNPPGIASTARVLNFQPENPNDVMPTPRKMKRSRRAFQANGFDLYEEMESEPLGIQVFTDTNARIPELDAGNDNPFLGSKQPVRRTSRHAPRKATKEALEMDDAVRNDEGVTYVFRGKKIFRRFKDSDEEAESQTSGSELGNRLEQRMLRRMAGETAQRPLTRSALKPRLLFPSEQDRAEREKGPDDVDEEALTDIDLSALGTSARSKQASLNHQTPNRVRFAHVTTPPPTNRGQRIAKKVRISPLPEIEATPSVNQMSEPTPSPNFLPKKTSPFDGWPRTKVGRKRSNDSLHNAAGTGKRTRGTALE